MALTTLRVGEVPNEARMKVSTIKLPFSYNWHHKTGVAAKISTASNRDARRGALRFSFIVPYGDFLA